MSRTALPISRTASTALRVEAWIRLTFWPISAVALAVCPARVLTSWATTAKPRPASPARAASIVALSASRLVCSAIAWIRLSTPSMRWVAAARLSISATDFSVRRPACSTTLGGLADLPADLLDGSRQFFGGAGDREHVAGGLLGRAGGGDGASVGIRRHPGDGLRGIAHRRRVVGDRAQHAADRAAERFDRGFDMPGPFFARLGVEQDLRIEIAVAVHRLLEDLDRACQRADLVGAIGMRNLDIVGAFGDLLDGGGDQRKRPRHRAGDDQDADADQRPARGRRDRSAERPVRG